MTESTLHISPNGAKTWSLDGRFHRDNGPAIISPDGKQEWYQNGLLHRIDGPAVIFPDGRYQWWIKGERHRNFLAWLMASKCRDKSVILKELLTMVKNLDGEIEQETILYIITYLNIDGIDWPELKVIRKAVS